MSDAEFISECLSGRLGRKHQAAANRAIDAALPYRCVTDSKRIAYVVRGLVKASSRW